MHELTAEHKGVHPDETVVETEITVDDILKKKRQIGVQARELLSKAPGTLAPVAKRLLMQFLMLTLYTGIQALPSDLSAVEIARLGEKISEITTDCLAEERIEEFTFYPKRTSVASMRKAGANRGKFSLPPSINRVVAGSLKVFPRAYLLSNEAGTSKMPPGNLRRIFSSMFLNEGSLMNSESVKQTLCCRRENLETCDRASEVMLLNRLQLEEKSLSNSDMPASSDGTL
ncbi:hypothetical protein KFL_006280020 [Klebsormidium nitens]|uniref:Uncharacterized protein n=1 Tax=Klebsormidium nitens TaxID=105231 RepID=A0A1Y1INY6_KLENI|nr:hypothetical protein KFL_006280020 [Klebsormidium nitens]|eukprot:GAQ90327.1 hypothetical protein KFL_006280020 [Klebsormidium nitens]